MNIVCFIPQIFRELLLRVLAAQCSPNKSDSASSHVFGTTPRRVGGSSNQSLGLGGGHKERTLDPTWTWRLVTLVRHHHSVSVSRHSGLSETQSKSKQITTLKKDIIQCINKCLIRWIVATTSVFFSFQFTSISNLGLEILNWIVCSVYFPN